ncbi:MAG TPA: TIR domain-containing protein [Thermoanaerobaculia bacterium]|jgi:hypothetical protein|nr:TIR domain-containing protein [Thermoanaerobaculia bacterium]
MARLFISYTREDGKEFAERLHAEIEGHDVWLDRSDLAGGDDWAREIENAIDESRALLAVLTNAYHKSKVGMMELHRAIRKKKPVIPLRIQADAEPPLFLETAQWVDFSDPATHATSLRALLDCIAALPEEASAPDVAAAATQWDAMVARAGKHTRRVIRPATFDESLYVRRETAEQELRRFLAEPPPALILTGDSGVGKTNLLYRWALDLLDEGHAVVVFDCSELVDDEIEEEIERDLAISFDALESIDAEASRAGRKLVLVFDSIGDYRGSERNGAQVLLRRINALVGRLPGENIRIVFSCNTATWNRLERQAPMRLDRDRYFHAGSEPFLQLGLFTEAERDNAYRCYQKTYELHSDLDALQPSVRERLREPVLLRMTAEAYRGAKQPLPPNLGLGIYQRFFDDRVSQPREVLLVDMLAEKMMLQQSSALSVIDLARDAQLGQEILNEDPTSTYAQLLDRRVLQESRGDMRAGMVVRFSHTRVAAYALARNRLRTPNVAETAADLVTRAAQFPLAWEAGKTLLLLSADPKVFIALAGSRNVEQRELAAEALVELHADDAKTAGALLAALLDQKSEETRRTALKAAYNIGPQARDFFLRAALEGEPSTRESLKNTLYLIWRNESPAGRQSMTDTFYLVWRHAPGFTYEFLNTLLDQIRLREPRRAWAILGFVVDLTMTIYVNHCDEEEVLDKTSALLHDLATKRFRLHRLTGPLGRGAETVLLRAVALFVGGPVLDWMMFADDVPPEKFFKLPAEQRASLSRITNVLDPAANLETARTDLLAMLQAEMPVFSGAAAMAIAIHATDNFAAVEPLIRQLWEELPVKARPWILYSFAVLLKDTPAEWVPLLEDLTRRYVEEHREEFLNSSGRYAGNLDVILLPLGLAYGKRGSPMPLFQKLLQDALAAGDPALASRCIAALGAVGFYYPHALFEVLRPAFEKLEDAAIQRALIATLATVRTLHFDAVDQFFDRIDAPEGFRRSIDAAADVALVHRYIRVLGYYNNSVHLALRYPRMRKQFAAGSLKRLAEARRPQQFLNDYATSTMQMLRDADFQLKNMTLPE